MKKENVIRKILVSSLIGIPLGIALLMIAYLGVYFIAGKEVFSIEISQLQNARILINQMLVLGLSYYIVLVSFYVFSYINNKEISDNYMTKNTKKSVIMILLSFIGFIVAMILISLEKIFTKNIATMNVIFAVILYAICGIIFLTKCTIESNSIKKINIKIQNRNK